MVKILTNTEIIRKSRDGRYAYIRNDNDEIEKRYIYYCCICNKEIIDYRPIRFTKKLYGYGKYKQYEEVRTYDFCKECYWALDDLLFKWKRVKKGI